MFLSKIELGKKQVEDDKVISQQELEKTVKSWQKKERFGSRLATHISNLYGSLTLCRVLPTAQFQITDVADDVPDLRFCEFILKIRHIH